MTSLAKYRINDIPELNLKTSLFAFEWRIMKVMNTLFFLVTLIVLAKNVLAEERLKVAFGNALAPWVMPSTNNGILLDIIKESLEPANYEIEPVYYPYGRRIRSYRAGLVDVATDINPYIMDEEGLHGFFSVIAYTYNNFAISLKERNYYLNKISDLKDYRILSWQGARAALGTEYTEMADNNPNYSEHHNQELQVKMLFRRRVDVIQLDEQIFQYYFNKVSNEQRIDTTVPIDKFPLFGKNHCGFLFRSKAARDSFNKHFLQLKKSGRYKQIYSDYLGNSKSFVLPD